MTNRQKLLDLARQLAASNGQTEQYLQDALEHHAELERARQARAETLHGRLGGSGGLSRIINGTPEGIPGLYDRVTRDSILMDYFTRLGRSDSPRWKGLKWHLLVFLKGAVGGDPSGGYQGRKLGDAHRGLQITRTAYDRLCEHLLQVLRDLDVSVADQQVVIHTIKGLRSEIVTFSDR